MYYVYIIQSTKNNRYYIGSTTGIEKRLAEHNKNQVKLTRRKGPYVLVYREGLRTKTEALKREHEIKKYKGNKRFQELVNK